MSLTIAFSSVEQRVQERGLSCIGFTDDSWVFHFWGTFPTLNEWTNPLMTFSISPAMVSNSLRSVNSSSHGHWNPIPVPSGGEVEQAFAQGRQFAAETAPHLVHGHPVGGSGRRGYQVCHGLCLAQIHLSVQEGTLCELTRPAALHPFRMSSCMTCCKMKDEPWHEISTQSSPVKNEVTWTNRSILHQWSPHRLVGYVRMPWCKPAFGRGEGCLPTGVKKYGRLWRWHLSWDADYANGTSLCSGNGTNCILRVHESCLLFQKLPVASVCRRTERDMNVSLGHRYSVAAIRLTISSNPLRSGFVETVHCFVTIYVQYFYYLIIYDWNHDFRTGFAAACDMSGKRSTSGTIRGHAFSHAVPQTPRPFPDTVAGNAPLGTARVWVLVRISPDKILPRRTRTLLSVQPPCWPLRLSRPVPLR